MKNNTWVDKLQRIDRKVLYVILIIVTTLPLFVTGLVIPTNTTAETESLYVALNQLEEGSVVAIESDWTVSSRGESAGQLEALLRILREKKVKFALLSVADAQAPQVARNVIRRVNTEFEDGGFKEWEDWVDLRYFPQPESILQAMAGDLRKAWGGREMVDPADGKSKRVFESPVLRDVKSLSDLDMYIIVTASGTPRAVIQRFGNPPKTKIACMVTGVMGPEHVNYFQAGQIVGLSVGLRGVVEIETMMANGLNYQKDGKPAKVKSDRFPLTIEPVKGKVSYARGMQYFFSLHMGLTALIVFVILGNLGLIANRAKKGAA